MAEETEPIHLHREGLADSTSPLTYSQLTLERTSLQWRALTAYCDVSVSRRSAWSCTSSQDDGLIESNLPVCSTTVRTLRSMSAAVLSCATTTQEVRFVESDLAVSSTHPVMSQTALPAVSTNTAQDGALEETTCPGSANNTMPVERSPTFMETLSDADILRLYPDIGGNIYSVRFPPIPSIESFHLVPPAIPPPVQYTRLSRLHQGVTRLGHGILETSRSPLRPTRPRPPPEYTSAPPPVYTSQPEVRVLLPTESRRSHCSVNGCRIQRRTTTNSPQETSSVLNRIKSWFTFCAEGNEELFLIIHSMAFIYDAACLIVGSVLRDKCPAEPAIVLCLMITGTLGVTRGLLRLGLNVVTSDFQDEYRRPIFRNLAFARTCVAIFALLDFGLFGNAVAGAYFVFATNTRLCSLVDSTFVCTVTCHDAIFVLLAMMVLFYMLFVIGLIVAAICGTCMLVTYLDLYQPVYTSYHVGTISNRVAQVPTSSISGRATGPTPAVPLRTTAQTATIQSQASPPPSAIPPRTTRPRTAVPLRTTAAAPPHASPPPSTVPPRTPPPTTTIRTTEPPATVQLRVTESPSTVPSGTIAATSSSSTSCCVS